MKAALIGHICHDKIIIGDEEFNQLGGLTYYAGQTLTRLGVDVMIYGTYGDEPDNWLNELECRFIRLPAEGTIEFVNEYPDRNDLDKRIQRAKIYNNEVRLDELLKHDLSDYDYIILGPLYHDNFSTETIKGLSRVTKAKICLAGQGLIRYLDGDKIIWKNPDNIINAMPYVNYLFLDDDELAFITSEGRNHFWKQARRLTVVVTDGKKGSKIIYPGGGCMIPAYKPRQEVDATGSGDIYTAGFIKALSMGYQYYDAGCFAAMTATIGLEVKGPFMGTTDDVIQRLNLFQQRI